MKTFNYKTMGVINITPDSFSDGNQFNHLDSFRMKFNEACSDFDIIDIGAESTAPFNKPISSAEELARFEDIFFPILKTEPDMSLTLSIDTYKIEVFERVYNEIVKYWPRTNIIFNDVSGCIDEALISLLRSDKKFSYVFSHNLCTSREQTNNHMSFVTGENIVENMKEFFVSNLKTLESFSKNIILDPCFGFSKSREQNHEIIRNMSEIFNLFPNSNEVVFGISRKSFLRFPRDIDLSDVENQKVLDSTQALIFSDLLRSLSHKNFIFRVHDLNSLNSFKNFSYIMSTFAK